MSKRPSIIGNLTLGAESAPAPAASAPAPAPAPAGRKPRPDIVHTSVYLPQPVYRKLREIAFTTDQKIHDVIMEGIDAALRKYGHPGVAELKHDSGKAP
jgi:hypothetical protein